MNIYIQTILNIAENKKFCNWYVSILERAICRAKSRTEANRLFGYSEKHHIVPESFFKNRKRKGRSGNLDGNPDHSDNIVYLTAKEHIFCHIFLSKMFNNIEYKTKTVSAVCKMLRDRTGEYQIKPRMYEAIRKSLSENNPAKFEESTIKSKQTRKEKYGSETYNNYEKAKTTWLEFYGVDHPNKVLVECPWCLKVGQRGGMLLTHFDKCKRHPNYIDNIPTYVCEICGKSIKGKGNYTQHKNGAKCQKAINTSQNSA